MVALLVVAFVVVPLVANQYWLSAILTPFLIFALAALGLNILTGYAGQLSLGTAAFMAVGAFAAYNFDAARSGHADPRSRSCSPALCAALVGIVFGLPSLRIKGFYLAVATLAAQFFVRLGADSASAGSRTTARSGVITAQKIEILGYAFDTPVAKYLLTLAIVAVLALAGEEPGAQRDRPRVDGGARHGRRGGGHRHPADAHQAARVRDQLVLLRRRRRAVRVLLPRHRGARGVQPRPVVPDPVHDHHRRRGQHPRVVPRRGVHRAAADLPQRRSSQALEHATRRRDLARRARCRTSS